MFDRSNQAHLDALKGEVLADPIGMNYGAADGDVDVRRILTLINDPANNVGGETLERRFTVRVLLEALDPAEYGSLPAAAREYIGLFLSKGDTFNLDPVKANMAQIFPSSGATRAAILGRMRTASRGEVLFGTGTIIDRGDLIAARDNGVV